MSDTNLIKLNVDALFEQHSVPEIDIVHKKIQTVVENKREELRTMVGERYRDLLQAADTIATMQESSSTLIAQVESITNNCRRLNEQQLIGFKTTETADLLRTRSAQKQQNNYFSTMVQIKLLTALPELIWSHLDQSRFYTATELFIFSRHISTGLQLDVNNILMQALPVARKQWEIIKPFHLTIKQCVLAELEREELTAEVAADCLLSLLLLEKNSLGAVLKTFLQLRTAAFVASLSEAARAEGAKRRVKERILASLKVLYRIVELITSCFLENGLLFQKLNKLTDPNAPPSIELMESEDRQLSYLLPDIIAHFRPKLETPALDEVQLRSAIEAWLADIDRISSVQLRQLFELVSTMSTIQEVKNEAKSWQSTAESAALEDFCCLNDSLNFYETKYAPLIGQRVRDIIRSSWQQAMNEMFSALHTALQAALPNSDAEHTSPSHRLWEYNTNDLPQSLEEALSEDPKSKKLLMKMKGYDEDVVSICTCLDNQLASIVAELDVLLEEPATKAEDEEALLEFLRDVARSEVMEFITKVKGLNLVGSQRRALLLVVRLLAALPELCPNLKGCFCQQGKRRQHTEQPSSDASEAWQRICQLVDEELKQLWLQIIKGILEENPCEKFLPKKISYGTILQDFTNWDTITLEQKDEQDQPVHTTSRVPSQPRVSVQTYLFRLIGVLNSSIPHSLPPEVLHTFNEHLLAQILSHYESHAASCNQNISLQLYFDLKFLLKLFAVSRDSGALYERFQKLTSEFKENIDPFDFELLEEHLSSNVKKSVCRLSGLLGVLVPNTAAASAASAASTVMQERDPNILTLSSSGSTSLWFPPLPIIDSRDLQSEKKLIAETVTRPEVQKETTPAHETTTVRKTEAPKPKSGAANFFGAISQDWFR